MAMRFTSDRKTLLSAVMPALAASSNKSTLPALEGLLFELKGNELTVCGYDLEKGVKTYSTVLGEGDGAVILNAQKISAIIRNFPDCDISFEANEKNTVTISAGMSEFSVHALSAEAFPNLPELSGDKSFRINAGLLKEIINSTYFAVAQTDARPILTGEYFEIKGDKLTVVTLDNHRLALREETSAIAAGSNAEMKFIVPGKSIYEFSKLLTDGEETVVVEFTGKHIIMKVGSVIFFSRLLEGEFLDYRKAIPSQNSIFVKIDRELFIDSVERASLLIDDKLITPLKCTFTGGNLNISCSTRYGKVNDNIPVYKDGDDIEIGFNNRYLLDALRACKDELILASLSSPLMSMVITAATEKEGSRYLYLVVPIRLNGYNAG
ncbi:MAG: DNA polymerase III subunit beta [Clostridia bacterium]|nr:DNA polymerase III subunit beta [Clostridia bacterium]